MIKISIENFILTIMNNLKLTNFIKQNKVKIYEQARRNININQNGEPTISKNDDWFQEDDAREKFSFRKIVDKQ